MVLKMKPKVTIGICVRDCERTIGQTIDSVINQDFPHTLMEIIFVDDGSVDETLRIIKDYASRIDIKTKIFHQAWKGLGAARNVVVDNASGDYIIWVDGDMIISPDFVRKQVEFMERNPQVGIAKGQHELKPGPNLASTLEIFSRAGGALKMLNPKISSSLGTGGCIYRKVCIKQVGGFDNNLKGYGEDWDAELRVRAIGWSLRISGAYFRDYERLGISYRDLWQKYMRRGRDLYYFDKKNKGLIKLHRMLPFASFLSGLLVVCALYRRTFKKCVFFLPFHNFFKATAWCWGFLKTKFYSR
jgi:glycosyltransferase involved in cell wall biosynthesis